MAQFGLEGIALAAAALACICALASVLAFAQTAAGMARARQVQASAGADGILARLLREGIVPLLPLAHLLLGMARVRVAFDQLVAVLALRVPGCTSHALCSVWLAVGILCALVGATAGSLLAGVLAFVAASMGASARCAMVLEARSESMRQQLPDALRALSACFHAGFTLQQTFEQLSSELDGPLQHCFVRARDQLRTGGSLDDALTALQHAGGPRELAFVAVALQVQHAAGGSMQHVLDTAGDSLSHEVSLRRSLKVQTAQARLSSKVVVGVTIGLVAVLALASEGFLRPFFESTLGMALLSVAVLMQLAGIVLVRRMLDVEVG